MPTIHMIHGFVGAGKTTFSKKLAKEINAIRFSPDEWMNILYHSNPPAENFAAYYKQIETVIWMTAERVLAAGVDVILDFGFWGRQERDTVRMRAEELAVSVKLYNLQCSHNIMEKRVLARTAAMPEGALFIDKNAIAEFKTRFEPIDDATEESILIDTNY